MIKFPAGVDWDGSKVTIAFCIAARGNGHGSDAAFDALVEVLATDLDKE
jgi:mannitol/fructose-specific phosphotransferase system IIA component